MSDRGKRGKTTASKSQKPQSVTKTEPEPQIQRALSIAHLYFGKDDAESDFTKGGLLKSGFLPTRAYEEALAGNKTLIIGRKGSGKSAICLVMQSELAEQGRACLITPDEISAEEIRRFHLSGILPEQSKLLIWRYVFAVQIAKYLLALARARFANGSIR